MAEAFQGFRLAVGTLTIVRTGAPRNVTPRTIRAAVLWAPLIGAALGAIAGAVATLAYVGGHRTQLAALLGAAAAIVVLAAATRALHLDGLADTADGLGRSGPPDRALAVMKQSDIGPFGVIALVLTLLVQVIALGSATIDGHGWLAIGVAVAASRTAIAWACIRAVPPARPDGLGAAWARALPNWAPILLGAGVAVAAAVLGVVTTSGASGRTAVDGVLAVVLGTAAALLLLARCITRLGGMTGDVIGAMVETCTTVALLAFAFG